MVTLILIYGPSGTGKTTLAHRLSADLHLPLFTKDSIKETLFESLPPGQENWSSQLSRASIHLLCQIVESMVAGEWSCIGEANFDTAVVRPIFVEMRKRYPFASIEIICRADAQVRLDRLQLRQSTSQRHAAHGNTAADITREWQDTEKRLMPIGLGGTCIELDTTEFPESAYRELLERIRAILKHED